jgi:hypothetical protein
MNRHSVYLTVMLVGCASVAFVPVSIRGQDKDEKYTIKIKSPQAKQSFDVTSTGKKSVSFKVVDANQNVAVDKAEDKTTKFIYREVGLEKPDKEPKFTKLQRHYSTAERRTDGKRLTLPYQGKTLSITKEKHGSYEFTLDGGEKLSIAESSELIEEFNKGGGLAGVMELLLARGEPVAVGETWKVDAAKLAEGFEKNANLSIDPAKSTLSGKLVRAYKKDGRQFGVIDLTIDLAVTAFIQDGNKLPTKDSGFKVNLECDLCIDGSADQSSVKGTFEANIRATVEQNGMQLTLTIGLQGEAHQTRREAAKK